MPSHSSNIRRSDLLQAAGLAKLGKCHEAARQIDDHSHQDQSGEDVAVLPERSQDLGERGKERDPVQAERFAGERQREQKDADDLAEPDRGDREVDAAEAEDREAEGQRERGGESRTEHQAERERDAEAHAEERSAVGADGHERGVAERELPGGERDPGRQGEQRVDADDPDRRLVDADEFAERIHYARSTARWPRRPRGRITSTRKRRPNANASRSSASSAGRNTSAAISPIPRM